MMRETMWVAVLARHLALIASGRRAAQAAAILLLPALSLVAATEGNGNALPLGHKDFYPTPDRPVGFRGDGSGVFPGAEG